MLKRSANGLRADLNRRVNTQTDELNGLRAEGAVVAGAHSCQLSERQIVPYYPDNDAAVNTIL